MCTDTSDLFLLGDFLVRKSSFLQNLLAPSPEAREVRSRSPSPGPKDYDADREEGNLAPVADTRMEHTALCKLLSLYQHQVLYAAVARVQREEERMEPGAVAPALFQIYRNLAAVCATNNNQSTGGENEIVQEDVLIGFQSAVQSSMIQ